MSSQIFRKTALDRISSPEQLDTLIQITKPQNWLTLIGLLVLVLAGVTWGILGRVPVEMDTPAVFIYPDGIQNVPLTASGQLIQIARTPGEMVQVGDAVAVIQALDGETLPVVSLQEGRVLELKASEGSIVSTGNPLMSLEVMEDATPIEAVFFLSAEEAATVAIGQPVKIATAYQEQLGYVYGHISVIDRYPATMAGLLNMLGSEDLIQAVVRFPSPIEVRVSLETKSTNNPQFSNLIRSGIIGRATITIDEQRPIEFVLPIGE